MVAKGDSGKGVGKGPAKGAAATGGEECVILRETIIQRVGLACAICLSEPVEILFKPCSHAGCCRACAMSIAETTSTCPFCRRVINFMEHITIMGVPE